MAAHFDVVVTPARVRKPQDKAKVEASVGLATRWILAVLRKRTFFSIKEANEAVAILLQRLNHKKFQKRPGSRQSLFDELDKPALRPLPDSTYEFAEIKSASINIDYHFVFESHMYSVPFKYRFGKVILRITNTTIEVLFGNKRIASHARMYAPGEFTPLPEHQPRQHKDYGNWSPEIIVEKGAKVGQATADLFKAIMAARPVAEQGFRSCMGILQLEKTFGKERLEASCAKALSIRGLSYKCRLCQIRTELQNVRKAAVNSLTEGMLESLTVHRLGITGMLRKSVRTTNIIESAFSSVRRYMGGMTAFQSEEDRERWIIRSLIETERHFRTLNGYRQLAKLKKKLKTYDPRTPL